MTQVALLQLSSPLDETQSARLERVEALLEDVADADLVVLPELWPHGYFAFDHYDEQAERLDGPLMRRLSGWARTLGGHLHAGSILERDSAGGLHNTAVLIGPDGQLLLSYRKIHVFGYQSLEAKLLTPGDRADVVDTALGPIATTTCYDLRFPELYRQLVDGGAEILIVPAAWPAARLRHWQLFTRARAVENQMFVLACNAAGQQGDVELAGHSAVIDPWGEVLAEAGTEETELRVEIDLAEVARTRNEFPVLDDRRLGRHSTDL